MKNYLKAFSISAIISALFYNPLIRLYHYIEQNSIEGCEIEEEKYNESTQ